MSARAAHGTIAVVGDPEPRFADAVRDAGGVVAPLSAQTDGLVWAAPTGEEELDRVLAAHPAISWVQLPWAGVDAFAGLLRRQVGDGRTWTSAKGAYARPVAEHALTLVLAVLRELPRRARAGSWEHDERGRTLHGARVVVIGGGGITAELLRLLAPFGVHVTVVRRTDAAVPGAERTVRPDRLLEVLADAEVVVVTAALTERTRGLVGSDAFTALPQGAILVNVARGAIVDTDALVAALGSGRLGGAGLDVTEPEPLPARHPLWSAPNCLVTPHVADTDAMTVPLFAERIGRNTRAHLGSGGFAGVIDLEAGY
ncbi:D-isomer specific 2-hydroxyacid dehydrogenase family protein [Agromyces arachidis]|uniref:D-isomer specific 2-hydroxyacid dehydrogenase family protein n=1 Tax=Agromyces arachidis TaxID=766966 RepID=UPI004056559E